LLHAVCVCGYRPFGENPKVTVTEKLRPAIRLGVSDPLMGVVAMN
jgi:hypothetical protein